MYASSPLFCLFGGHHSFQCPGVTPDCTQELEMALSKRSYRMPKTIWDWSHKKPLYYLYPLYSLFSLLSFLFTNYIPLCMHVTIYLCIHKQLIHFQNLAIENTTAIGMYICLFKWIFLFSLAIFLAVVTLKVSFFFISVCVCKIEFYQVWWSNSEFQTYTLLLNYIRGLNIHCFEKTP